MKIKIIIINFIKALVVEIGNSAITVVPFIDGKISTVEKSQISKIAGDSINYFMLKMIYDHNVLPYGVVIKKEDFIFNKDLYEVSNDLQQSFSDHGYQNYSKILNEQATDVNSYIHTLPSELVKKVQLCIESSQVYNFFSFFHFNCSIRNQKQLWINLVTHLLGK